MKMFFKTNIQMISFALCKRALSGQSYFRHSRDIGVLSRRTGSEMDLSMKRSKSSGFINVNDAVIHYEQAGKGKNVVLLMPGAIGTARTDFKPQLDHLHRDMCTVVAWDPPGYGKSTPQRTWPHHWFERDAMYAATFMANLGHDKYSVLGWSDGGITALLLASLAPQHVQKLVVWGANAYVTAEEVADYAKISDISKWSSRMRAPFVEEYGEQRFQQLWHEWIDAVTHYHTGPRKGNFCKEQLPSIKCPTLIVHGMQDAMCPHFHAKYLRGHIPNSRLVEMEAKHNLHLRYFKEFNHMVENFIAEPTAKL